MSSLKSYRAITVADLGVRPDQNEHAESAFAPLTGQALDLPLASCAALVEQGKKPFQLKLEKNCPRSVLVSI